MYVLGGYEHFYHKKWKQAFENVCETFIELFKTQVYTINNLIL